MDPSGYYPLRYKDDIADLFLALNAHFSKLLSLAKVFTSNFKIMVGVTGLEPTTSTTPKAKQSFHGV